MKLRTLSIFVLALCTASVFAQSESDIYSIRATADALAVEAKTPGLKVSWVEKHVWASGDAVSIALLKTLDEHQLVDPKTIRTYLPIIRDAFDDPTRISLAIDKQPKVTMFLLAYLRQNVRDPSIQAELRQVSDSIAGKIPPSSTKD